MDQVYLLRRFGRREEKRIPHKIQIKLIDCHHMGRKAKTEKDTAETVLWTVSTDDLTTFTTKFIELSSLLRPSLILNMVLYFNQLREEAK